MRTRVLQSGCTDIVVSKTGPVYGLPHGDIHPLPNKEDSIREPGLIFGATTGDEEITITLPVEVALKLGKGLVMEAESLIRFKKTGKL